MARRPTIDSFTTYLGVDTLDDDGFSDADDDPIRLAFNTALEYWETRVDATLVAKAGYALDVDTENYPYGMRSAVLGLASRLYKLKSMPEGQSGFGGFAGVTTVATGEPNLEILVEQLIKIGGFA